MTLFCFLLFIQTSLFSSANDQERVPTVGMDEKEVAEMLTTTASGLSSDRWAFMTTHEQWQEQQPPRTRNSWRGNISSWWTRNKEAVYQTTAMACFLIAMFGVQWFVASRLPIMTPQKYW